MKLPWKLDRITSRGVIVMDKIWMRIQTVCLLVGFSQDLSASQQCFLSQQTSISRAYQPRNQPTNRLKYIYKINKYDLPTLEQDKRVYCYGHDHMNES